MPICFVRVGRIDAIAGDRFRGVSNGEIVFVEVFEFDCVEFDCDIVVVELFGKLDE